MADDKTVVNTNITEFRKKLDAYRKTHPTQAKVTKIYDSEESVKLQEEAEQLGLNFDSEVEQSHKREVDEFRKKLDAYRKDNPTDDYKYLYDTAESVALESEAYRLGLDIDAELEASHNRDIDNFRKKLDDYRKENPTSDYKYLYDTAESVELESEADKLGLDMDDELEEAHNRDIKDFRHRLDEYRKENPTSDHKYLYDTAESVALESEADNLGLDMEEEIESSHTRQIEDFRQRLDAYRKANPTSDYKYLYDTAESVELESEAYELGLDLEAEIESSHTRELEELDNREDVSPKEKSNRINLRHGIRIQNKYGSKKEENLSNDYELEQEEETLDFDDNSVTPNGAIIGDPPRNLGASIGDKLKGVYEVRQIRKGQIQYAGQTIRETTRDRENPEIDKGGQEYDE